MSTHFIDEIEGSVGWIESERMQRTSHALSVDGRVWLIDPIDGDGVEERIRGAGEPAGVIQLLDRHGRDSTAWAKRLGVPLHVVPHTLPGTPFELLPIVGNRWWKEVALLWPERRTLVCADALGTISFFRAGDEPAGLHPLLRFRRPRALAGLGVEHLLVGHGEGIHGEAAAAAVDRALRTGRRRIPRWLAQLPQLLRTASPD
ncbi:MAG: hypothetical protein H0V45_16130 [Actinobacteria bacterium]|nr:hypothetical protein [Actinomycetota bacterium]